MITMMQSLWWHKTLYVHSDREGVDGINEKDPDEDA